MSAPGTVRRRPAGERASRGARLVAVGRWLCGRSLRQAYGCAEQAIAEAQAADEPETLAFALNLMGTIELDLNLLASARVSFRRARDVALQCHSLPVQVRVANNAALMHMTTGDCTLATQQLQFAQTLTDDPAYPAADEMPGLVRVNAAELHNRLDEPERALHVLDTHDLMHAADPSVRVYAALTRAAAHLLLTRQAQARQRTAERTRHLAAARRALECADRDEDAFGRFVVLASRADLWAQWLTLAGQPDRALDVLRSALVEVQGEYADGVIALQLTLAGLLEGGDPEAAAGAYAAALALMDQGGVHHARAGALECLARLRERQGQLPEALALLRQMVQEIRSRPAAVASPALLPLSVPSPAASSVASSVAGTGRRRGGSAQAAADLRDWQDRLWLAERQARTDRLTGLANRLMLDETLPGLIQRLSLPHHALHVLLLDLDHFKVVNDRYSHGVGDQVLRRVAALLPVVAGNDSLTARYGGEELLVCLTHGTLAEAQRVAEELRVRVAALRWPDGPERITVSVGVAEANADDTQGSLIARADEALYAAKRAGRNRVSVAASPGVASPGVALPA